MNGKEEFNSIIQVEAKAQNMVLDFLSYQYYQQLSVGKAEHLENGCLKISFNLTEMERRMAEIHMRQFFKKKNWIDLPYCWKR